MGVKVFVLADATNWYIKQFQIYTGAGTAGEEHTTADDGTGATARLVLGLLNGLEQHYPRLFVDNYYISPKLFLALYNKGVCACGTTRSNRKYFPRDLVVTKSAAKGHYDYRSSGPLLACCWVDDRPIYFVTTIHVARAPAHVHVYGLCVPL